MLKLYIIKKSSTRGFFMDMMDSDSAHAKKKKKRKKKLLLELAAVTAAYLALRDRLQAIYASLQAVESQIRLDNNFSLNELLTLVSANLAAARGDLEELENSNLPEASAMADKLRDKIAAATITLAHEQRKLDEKQHAKPILEEVADVFLSETETVSSDEELTADEALDIETKMRGIESYLLANLPEVQVDDTRLAVPAKVHKFSGPRLTMHSRPSFVDHNVSPVRSEVAKKLEDEVKLYLRPYGNTGVMLGVLARPVGPLSFAYLPRVGLVPMGQGSFDLHEARMVSSVISFLRPTLGSALRADEKVRPPRTPFNFRPGGLPA